MKECKHKFEPRYSKEWSTDVKDTVSSKAAWRGLDGRAYLKKETYVCDICIKCGAKK
ncbi:hypothetical protein LCGC14_2722500 [marine sediment metagenome]|uniref:Uncharacterized protein n=1 Tax=marine sediment metagenome TaxID=412755 RepID=A0A0F9BIU7_9ZZZZ